MLAGEHQKEASRLIRTKLRLSEDLLRLSQEQAEERFFDAYEAGASPHDSAPSHVKSVPRVHSRRARARQTARNLRESLDAFLYSRPDMVHRPGSTLPRTVVEEHTWLELALFNMRARHLNSVEGIYTEAYLRNPPRPMSLKERILDMVGLQADGAGQALEFPMPSAIGRLARSS